MQLFNKIFFKTGLQFFKNILAGGKVAWCRLGKKEKLTLCSLF